MDDIRQLKLEQVQSRHKSEHEGYEYYKREIVPIAERKQCCVNVYEIPPGKAAYPYHYHLQNEEVFFILKGTGTLKTPQGEKTVSQGDFLFFPANENGAHKLTNTSLTDMLVYIDFDTIHPLDVAFYPDSGKVGIFSKDFSLLYRTEDRREYYDGE